jgi:hypothetical protein
MQAKIRTYALVALMLFLLLIPATATDVYIATIRAGAPQGEEYIAAHVYRGVFGYPGHWVDIGVTPGSAGQWLIDRWVNGRIDYKAVRTGYRDTIQSVDVGYTGSKYIVLNMFPN